MPGVVQLAPGPTVVAVPDVAPFVVVAGWLFVAIPVLVVVVVGLPVAGSPAFISRASLSPYQLWGFIVYPPPFEPLSR